jgi:hypothetical protein
MRSNSLKSVTCPHCGLALAVSGEDGLTIRYDPLRWENSCKWTALGSPAHCLLQPIRSVAPVVSSMSGATEESMALTAA